MEQQAAANASQNPAMQGDIMIQQDPYAPTAVVGSPYGMNHLQYQPDIYQANPYNQNPPNPYGQPIVAQPNSPQGYGQNPYANAPYV